MIHITKKDRFVWLDLTSRVRGMNDIEIQELWMGLEFYAVLDDDSESLITEMEELKEAIDLGFKICIEAGHLPQPEAWWGKAKKFVKDGYWYIRVKDVKNLAHVQF